MKKLEIHLNWKWFLNYFDILKSIYHTGYFLIRHQEIVCWKPTFAEAFQEGMKKKWPQGTFSVQGFEDVDPGSTISTPRVRF